MIELTPQQNAAHVVAAGKAAIEAEQHEAPAAEIHVVSEDGMLIGSLVVGLACKNTPDTVRLTAMCSFATEWSAVIDKVEVITLNAEEQGVLVGLRSTSDSAPFLSARLRQAARSIGAAMMTIKDADQALAYTSIEKASEDLRARYPGKRALHERIALQVLGTSAYISNQAACDALLEHLETPERMTSEVFEQLLQVAARMESKAAREEHLGPALQATQDTLTDIIDRSPWMMIPGESIVRKDSYAQRPSS